MNHCSEHKSKTIFVSTLKSFKVEHRWKHLHPVIETLELSGSSAKRVPLDFKTSVSEKSLAHRNKKAVYYFGLHARSN